MGTPINAIRAEVKKYIDEADDHVVKMVYALLEADAADNDWDDIPDEIKDDLELSLKQADEGKTMTHEEVMKKRPEWFSK